ncbi:MAG TPA: metallopeptidase TldD-related protein [Bryobacteraceae bacterium]|nr:metallopeptidase TldD-related protein [Bryobacteraceae bacterium]
MHRLAICALAAAAFPLPAQQSSSAVLDAMKAELSRSQETLKSQPVPAYYIGYQITETHGVYVSATFGRLQSSSEDRRRQLDIDLRVGDYSLDNSREIRGEFNFGRFTTAAVPIDNDPDAIRAVLWHSTDQQYKQALERFTKVKTNVQVKAAQEDSSADFSREQPEHYTEPIADVHVNRAAWEDKLRKYTAPFARYTNIYQASSFLQAAVETRWFVNTEGTVIQTSQPGFYLFVMATTKASDGMELPLYESYFGFSEKDLPDDATVLKAVEKMIHDLEALRVAPVADAYTGPAILSGRASGVFFHEIFGHRVEGQRQKNSDDAQTFKGKIGQQVLAKDFSVYFDPTRRRLGNTDLDGYYEYDNQGVKARRVTVVENGILKTFLMSRTPVQGIAQSNGHGRGQVGLPPVARQSNLIVEVAPAAVQPDLKKLLIAEIKKQGLPFGLYFDQIEGGFTFTGRVVPNAFNVLPLMVYRVYPDGREELVRGADLIGTALTTFSKITAADRNVGVFNGFCGAESGSVPVSASSPGIFVAQIEVQKKAKSQERIPILPAPFEGGK